MTSVSVSTDQRYRSGSIYGSRPTRSKRAGAARVSVFQDQIWHLSPIVLQEHLREISLNFRSVPDGYVEHCKELCLALLVEEPPPGESLLSPATIRKHFGYLKEFVWFLDARGVPGLNAVSPDDLEQYRLEVAQNHPGDAMGQYHRVRVVRLLYLYGEHLPSGRLSADPYALASWSNNGLERVARRENSTARIPEPVLYSLIE